MRKTMALALAGALILSLATAGLAQAVNSHQSVAVKLAHSKAGTAAKPKSVGELTVDMNGRARSFRSVVRDPLGRDPLRQGPRLQHARSSPAAPRRRSAPAHAACAKAKIGSGKAAGLAVGQREDLAVTAYNGPGGKAVLLHVTGSKPLKIDSVIVGKLNARQRRLRPQARRRHPGQPPAAADRAVRHADLVRDERRRQRQGHALRRAEGLLRRQAQVQGRLRLHRRLQAVADVDEPPARSSAFPDRTAPQRSGGPSGPPVLRLGGGLSAPGDVRNVAP